MFVFLAQGSFQFTFANRYTNSVFVLPFQIISMSKTATNMLKESYVMHSWTFCIFPNDFTENFIMICIFSSTYGRDRESGKRWLAGGLVAAAAVRVRDRPDQIVQCMNASMHTNEFQF